MEIEKILSGLYRNRFSKEEIQKKQRIWGVLCRSFFQKYVNTDDAVLDIGAGMGEFINNIKCKEKYAVDLNEDAVNFLNPEVKFFNRPANHLSFLSDKTVDVVFMSNFSEHLKTKESIIETLLEVIRVLKSGGRLIIMGPNIRFVYREYWDFFDHQIPLSDRGLLELLITMGFKAEMVLAQFLPYTTKSKIPKCSLAVKMYLKIPFIWKIMGKQMLIIARKGI